MSLIDNYLPGVWPDAGDTGANPGNMTAPFKTGLLHLINYLMHTKDGRTFMHGLIPGKGTNTVESIRPTLIDKYSQFNVTGPAAEALIGAHIAGFAWADAYGAQPQDTVKMAQQENIFKQHVAAISWALWDESQGPMFSLGW